MTTILAIKKDNKVVIGADTLTKFGSQKENAILVKNPSKLVQIHDNYFGVTGSASWPFLLRSYFLKALDRVPDFSNTQSIFEEMDIFHHYLKTDKYLIPTSGSDNEFESSHMVMLIVNNHGIFGVYPFRQIIQYNDFMAIGSGDRYALGAINVLINTELSAYEIAKSALETAAFFDDSTMAPFEFVELELEGSSTI